MGEKKAKKEKKEKKEKKRRSGRGRSASVDEMEGTEGRSRV